MNERATATVRWTNLGELRALIAPHVPPCISLYMPTHPGGHREDPAHFAGLVRRVRAALEQHLSRRESESLLDEIEGLFRPQDWSNSQAGLALFRSHDFQAVYRLPMTLVEKVVVADSFHVRPMLEYLRANQRYFLLVLSQGRIRLFKGGLSGLVPIESETMPGSKSDVVAALEPDRNRTVRAGGRQAIVHSQGKSDDLRDEELLQVFRQVDRALSQLLRDERAPIVVAAPDRQFALFVSVCRNAHLLREGIHGNFARESLRELHERAWPLVQRHAAELEDGVLERYQTGVSNDLSSDEVSFIARAAVSGRVRELVLERGATLWGRLDPNTGAIELWNAKRDLHDDDLLDDLAEAVILRGADVLSLERERMPTRSPVAATLRW
jgi:hypothetical protein